MSAPLHAAITITSSGRQSRAQDSVQAQQLAQNAAAAYEQAAVAALPTAMPIPIADRAVADAIANGDSELSEAVADCAAIDMMGQFEWAVPTAGVKSGGHAQCVAVVEMRRFRTEREASVAYGDNSDIVLATARVAAGDTIDCNIDKFPSDGYLPAAGQFEFPADHEPTMDDVISVMNREQKQNAGIKIIAGTVGGGLIGNFVDGGNIGMGKNKVDGTLIGAATGAAIMTGGSYAGKVGGDVIMGAGINAVGGGLIGNAMASGNSIVMIEKCGSDKCLWGVVDQGEKLDRKYKAAFVNQFDQAIACNKSDDGAYTVCTPVHLVYWDVSGHSDYNSETDSKKLKKISDNPNNPVKYCYDKEKMTAGDCGSDQYYRVELGTAKKSTQAKPALIIQIEEPITGLKLEDFNKNKKEYANRVFYRNTDGTIGDPFPGVIGAFKPLIRRAEDGAIVDINNKARLGATAKGAAVGGAIGGLAAYQGAQNDIDERWVSEVMQYKDSLQKVYCGTGKRYLSSYNDIAIIPRQR